MGCYYSPGQDIRGISVPPTNQRDSEVAANGAAVSYTLKMQEIIIKNRFTKLHLCRVLFLPLWCFEGVANLNLE